MANESEAIQLKFGLSLQQIMDVVSDAFIKLEPSSPDWADKPSAHTLISSRLGGNVFSKKIKHFQFNFRKERTRPNLFKHKLATVCDEPEGTECDYYANIQV